MPSAPAATAARIPAQSNSWLLAEKLTPETLGKLVANLKAAGYTPDQVDDVLITHMHPDHVGGLVANGAVVFANATIHADQHDADYWLSKATLDHASADAKSFVPEFVRDAMASLTPYIANGKFQPFQGSGEILPGFKAWSSYGHTVGHTSYIVESKGQKLIVWGDLIHVGSVQFPNPTVVIHFDSDSKDALAQRLKIFADVAKQGLAGEITRGDALGKIRPGRLRLFLRHAHSLFGGKTAGRDFGPAFISRDLDTRTSGRRQISG